MNWRLSSGITLHNARVQANDAERQTRTAEEILQRLNRQPGVILADEVGMGKTYVALAVAVSVIEATRRQQPVVVLVPPAVAEKWMTEWHVFSGYCLGDGHGIRAASPVRKGSELLKLLDDPIETRPHLILVTHSALSNRLTDPFVRLALLRQATLYRRDLVSQRRSLARFAGELLNYRDFRDEQLVEGLLAHNPSQWLRVWHRLRPTRPMQDDPVPAALLEALPQVDLESLRDAILNIPVRRSQHFATRIQTARQALAKSLDEVWHACLARFDAHFPLVILDEAHHVKNDNLLAGLFASDGPLGRVFDRMLFLTATPFQLRHQELLRVLDRFRGVRWPSPTAYEAFAQQCSELGAALDRARGAALRLEYAWGRLDPTHTPWVSRELESLEDTPAPVRAALDAAKDASARLQEAEQLLKPWVIRHRRTGSTGRRYLAGRGIVDGQDSDVGLLVEGAATLPFLLAARAQALASLKGADGLATTRATYAYGLASSFEAYLDTRRNQIDGLDRAPDEPAPRQPRPDAQLTWYLDRIERALPRDGHDGWTDHPKVAATTGRVLDLWRDGEKVLVFCFYRETGRALRSHISRALQQEVVAKAAAVLGLDPADHDAALAELERKADPLLRSDSQGFRQFIAYVRDLTAGLDDRTAARVGDTVTRFMRTPSFLVRFAGLAERMTIDNLIAGLERKDGSGSTMAMRIRHFSSFVQEQVDEEREALFAALTRIQTGSITATADHFDPSERSKHREHLLPNVRLANGEVRRDTRERLMLTFNTPFFPEVLVASSVMAEGVDLHHECRHVIHHDLDWNPSTLEQRTGRVDRIRSRAARTGQPVVVYEPYVAGTHDEKMFRVVKDRERWFGIVMGQAAETSERATERQAARVPLPDHLAHALTLDLSVFPDGPDDALIVKQRRPDQVESTPTAANRHP